MNNYFDGPSIGPIRVIRLIHIIYKIHKEPLQTLSWYTEPFIKAAARVVPGPSSSLHLWTFPRSCPSGKDSAGQIYAWRWLTKKSKTCNEMWTQRYGINDSYNADFCKKQRWLRESGSFFVMTEPANCVTRQGDMWIKVTRHLLLGKLPQVNSPALLALEFVDRSQDVTESTSCLEIQETLGLRMEESQWGRDASTHRVRSQGII